MSRVIDRTFGSLPEPLLVAVALFVADHLAGRLGGGLGEQQLPDR